MSEIKLTGFELLEKIGQGGMGAVWKARQLSLDRVVAIKLLAPELNKNPDDVKRMLTEARTAARLKHAGIVQVYDASEEGGCFFFVMEFVDGYNVGQWVHRKKTIPWKDALLVAEYVAVALDYAWRSSGMIHCDIKPENIMVDNDGSIKVADLGLSVTHETRSDVPTDILGTPSYMSPEQVRGDPGLDCRTDIYSLGATLYQMITGRRLFQEVSDRDAMDCQLTRQVPDPQELVPGLPVSVASLLERLLVKDREGRPKDWAAVIHDLRRVQRGLMPSGKPPPPGASTVKCAHVNIQRDKKDPEVAPPKRRGWGLWVFAVAALVVAAVVLPPRVARWRAAHQPGAVNADGSFGTQTMDDSELGRDQAIASFESAERWMQMHPDRFDEAMLRYRKVIAQFPGTPEAAQAAARVKRMRDQRDQSIVDVWNSLRGQAQALGEARQYREAAVLLESYAGRCALQTASNRLELARQFRQRDDEKEKERLEEENWLPWVKDLGVPLTLGKFSAAQQAVSQVQGEGRFQAHASDIAALAQIMKGIENIDERILQSFLRQTGTVVRVGLGRGEITVTIAGIEGKKVRGRTGDGQTEVLIGYEDLSIPERVARLGPVDAPEVAIVKGVAAIAAGALDQAEKCFERAGPLLSGPLLDKLAELRSGTTDDKAILALARVLKLAGATVGSYDEAAWIAAAGRCSPDRERAARVSAELDQFLEKFGKSPFAAKATPVVLMLQQICVQAEEGSATVPAPAEAPVAEAPVEPGLPGIIDSEGLRQALATRNPGLEADAIKFSALDGVEDAKVEIKSDWVRDVSPLAAVKGIKALHLKSAGDGQVQFDAKSLAGSGITELRLERYVIKDATPLRTCRLTRLAMPGSPLMSITPLEGMGLIALDISGSEVRDLNAVRGMRLEMLDISNTKIASLVLLAGMPLRDLNASGTQVRDLSALKGMPLESLNVARTPIYDVQGLKGLRLTNLDLSGTKVHDLAFSMGMPLKSLILRDTLIQDVSVLKGRTLETLDLGGSQVKSLAGLAGCNIKALRLDNTKLAPRDLTQLQQVSCEELNLSGTGANTLSFLEGKKLKALQIENTKVKDLTPLRGMPLRELNCQSTDVTDYAALRNMPLEDLRISGDLRDLRGIIGSLLKLNTVNGFDVRERLGRPAERAEGQE